MRIAMRRSDIKWVRFKVKGPKDCVTDIDFTNIYFTVKKSAKDKNVIFQKSLKNNEIYRIAAGDYQFKIDPPDTRDLAVQDYVFDIQVMYQNIIKETFVGTFAVKEEITYEENEDIVPVDFSVPQVPEQSVLVLKVPEFFVLTLDTPEPVIVHSDSYHDLADKPKINNVTIDGELSLDDLGILHRPLSAEDIDNIIDSVDNLP
jgi:hypothetical protein